MEQRGSKTVSKCVSPSSHEEERHSTKYDLVLLVYSRVAWDQDEDIDA